MTVRSRSDGLDLTEHNPAALGLGHAVADGGDGAACRVPACLEGVGGGFCYLGLQDVRASLVARGASPTCTGTAGIPPRSRLPRRWSPVVDARLDLRQKKMPHGVKRMRNVEIRRKGVQGGC